MSPSCEQLRVTADPFVPLARSGYFSLYVSLTLPLSSPFSLHLAFSGLHASAASQLVFLLLSVVCLMLPDSLPRALLITCPCCSGTCNLRILGRLVGMLEGAWGGACPEAPEYLCGRPCVAVWLEGRDQDSPWSRRTVCSSFVVTHIQIVKVSTDDFTRLFHGSTRASSHPTGVNWALTSFHNRNTQR